MPKLRIAHLSGPTATIQNTPPLVTSNKAREKYGLPPLRDDAGDALRFDPLRPQRLAAPATVYVEQFSGHPLERDAADLYAPPDGYLDARGRFHRERQSPQDTPVFEVELRPEDGLYPMPYMARQADGRPWEIECTDPGAPPERVRQTFFPDGSRSFEEIDRLQVDGNGHNNQISRRAQVDFHRVIPGGGYTKGLPAGQRTDAGQGDIAPEHWGRDFFSYKPPHLSKSPPRQSLAVIANRVQDIVASGSYDGAIWTQGSPRVEETVYWLSLMLDTTLPVCCNAAQRPHGTTSADGPQNIIDSVRFIESGVWADDEGRNRTGVVLVQDQRVFAAREVVKADARPGGFVATGGHGGVIGSSGPETEPVLTFIPASRHTWRSQVNIARLPDTVTGVLRVDGQPAPTPVQVKQDGRLRDAALPKVSIIKDGNYPSDDYDEDERNHVDLLAMMDDMLARAPLAGFVVEGQNPYGFPMSEVRRRLLVRAIFSGLPVVGVGRGNTEGFAHKVPPFIGGQNLTSQKARLLLMACLMKFGSFPAAADPDHPTAAEHDATLAKLKDYQSIFDTH